MLMMLNQQSRAINIIQKIGDAVFSVLAQALQVSVQGGRIGAVSGLIFGIILWLFFKQNTNFGIFEGAIIGMAFVGLIGIITGGLIGTITGTLNIYRKGQLYELYIYLMVWLGAAPPIDFKPLQAGVPVEAGVGHLMLQICFWISFWAIEGTILGAIGGVFFGLWGFVWTSRGEAIILTLFWSLLWGISGALYGVIIGPSLWLTSQIVKRVKNGGSHSEILFWVSGGKIGEKIFNKLFGDKVRKQEYLR